MFTIFKKEINTFFSSLIGYIAITVFLLATGLFIWIFPDTNLLDYGFASMDGFFGIAPWILMFLIPAITMRTFSEEISSGTIELLATRPVSDMAIIMGKFFAAVFLVVFSLLPTLLYYFTIYQLSTPVGNVDSGAVWGSYIGLVFLGAAFTSIGLFSSSITSNQIVAFILALFLCFFFYIAFDFLSRLQIFFAKADYIIEQIGISAHYVSVSRGVVDTRDLVYFLSLIAIFILFTKTSLESRKW